MFSHCLCTAPLMMHADGTCKPCLISTYPSGLVISGDVMQRALSIAPAQSQLASLATRESPGEYMNTATVENDVQVSWFLTEPGTFDAVKQACLDDMGEIASIHSAAENQAVDALCTVAQCYIGYIRDSAPGVWYWSSGDEVVYVNWHPTEPGSTETKAVILSGGWWADYGQGQLIYPGVCRRHAAGSNTRAIALFPVQAQLSTFANRNQRLHTATAIFDSTAGPSGSTGAVTFDRASSQYIDGGPHTFDIASNGGFTAVVVFKLTGGIAANERIFNFANGPSEDNIMIARVGNSNDVWFAINNGDARCNVKLVNGYVQNSWQTIVASYDSSTDIMHLQVGSENAYSTCATTRVNRVVSFTYIGKSSWPDDPYAQVSIAGLYAVDAVLSEAEISDIVSKMYQGKDTPQA